MKVWNRAEIKLTAPGSAVGLITNCTTGPGVVIEIPFFYEVHINCSKAKLSLEI